MTTSIEPEVSRDRLVEWVQRFIRYPSEWSVNGGVKMYRRGGDDGHRGLEPPVVSINCSERGSQYAVCAYGSRLSKCGLAGSVKRRGDPYDNAVMESSRKTLKVEADDTHGFRERGGFRPRTANSSTAKTDDAYARLSATGGPTSSRKTVS